MTRLVHLSDLHFGATTPDLLDRLLEVVAGLAPDLVVVSGDLTQRARAEQFAEARAFLAALGRPWLAVPGNHDMPLWNLPLRLFAPFARYRRAVGRELQPVWQDDRVVVAGVNTANPLAWKQGRITDRQLDRIGGIFAAAGDRARVVVMHHPLEHLPQETQWQMQGAALALDRLPDLGAQIVLSGHIHVSYAGPFRAAPGLLFVQAGTGLSHRTRTERNAFNCLDFGGGGVDVRTITADETGSFAEAPPRRFRLDGTWKQQD